MPCGRVIFSTFAEEFTILDLRFFVILNLFQNLLTDEIAVLVPIYRDELRNDVKKSA